MVIWEMSVKALAGWKKRFDQRKRLRFASKGAVSWYFPWWWWCIMTVLKMGGNESFTVSGFDKVIEYYK